MPQQKVDPRVFELALHFIGRVKGVTDMEITELSEQIQQVCEDWVKICRGDYDHE